MYKRPSPKLAQNNLLLFSVFLTLLLSLFLVYNASSTYAYNYFGSSYYFLINQVVWVVAGTFVFAVIQVLPTNFVKSISVPLFFISVFFLLVVLIPSPFSLQVYGARRWILLNPEPFPEIPFIGRVSFQPSELMKLSTTLLIPLIYLKMLNKDSFSALVKSCLYFMVPALLILIEPDLKDALILVFIGASVLFAAGVDYKYFFYAIPIGVVLLLLVILTSPYRMERVKTYMGFGDIIESSYHAQQLNIALGSGGIFGLGVGQSRQKNEYLPEVVGDSIFAIFGEEFGFVGSLFLISLVSFVFFALFKSIIKTTNIYERLVGVGVLSWFGVQSLLNMGSISGLIPLTGVPLPLISYGGSSLVFMMAGVGLVYKFSKN
jgi:cell division protein FtsW